MTDKPGFLVEIDGEPIEFTGVYEIEDGIYSSGVGCFFGEDQNTAAEDNVIGFTTPGKHVAILAIYRNNPDGSIWGIKGVFRKGQWAAGEEDMPLFRVWDRLA